MRVLLLDDDAGRTRDLARALAADSQVEVMRLSPGASLPEGILRYEPDAVLVTIARPDQDVLDRLRRVSAGDAARPIVLFVDEDDPDFMEEAIAVGVCSYNVAGAAVPAIQPLLRAAALFRRQRAMAEELRAAESRLAERRAVERAKAALIRQRRLTEPDAYRWLQREAMRRGERIADVAVRLLREQEDQA